MRQRNKTKRSRNNEALLISCPDTTVMELRGAWGSWCRGIPPLCQAASSLLLVCSWHYEDPHVVSELICPLVGDGYLWTVASNSRFSLLGRCSNSKLVRINLSLHELRFDIYIYILHMFGVVYKKSHFLRLTIKNTNLNLPRFACRANRDSESRSKTTTKLVSTPQIQ